MSQVTHGFELIREQVIPEIKSTTRIYRHVKTGAELLSIINDDENKAFAITFATPPPDSSGLPHILEHSVLCGSRKYPTKEPFVDLIKSSLATFLNAFTFPDKTMYPIASQNLKDFYNLVDVYLDAVFFPRITPEILMQEGWHFELDTPDEPLRYSGVVFNEMKGAYSSADDALDTATQVSLYPDNAYGVDSGGDPAAIPDLTYDAFKQFHQTYYHPSNARIFFAGDDDPTERLRILDAYLSEFEPITVDARIQLQAKFDAPRQSTHPYDAGDSDDPKSYITISWLLPEPQDVELMLGLDILNYILLGTQAAPLKKALLESGLGEETAGGGFEDSMRQMNFITGMRGVKPEDADKIEPRILQTLEKLATEGIEAGQIEASLNTVEFSLREFNTGGFPRGLVMCIRAFSTWLYGGDPVAPLAFEAPLNAIKARLAQGEHYFESLIREHLLDNKHRSTVILNPDATLGEKRAQAERQRLDAIRAGMDNNAIQQVIADTVKLREMQEAPDTPEALATLPVLTIDDIDATTRTVPIEHIKLDNVHVIYHDLPTNGIAYMDIGFNLRTLPADYLPYLPIFSRALLQMGTTREDYVTLTQRIGRRTGGIGVSNVMDERRHSDDLATYLFLRGKSTVSQVPDMLEIVRDVLLDVNFDDRARFTQIVLSEKAKMEASLIPAGHRVVAGRLSAGFSLAAWLREQSGGISYLFFLRELAARLESDWEGVLHALNTMRGLLFNRATLLVNLTVDGESWDVIKPNITQFAAALPQSEPVYHTWQANLAPHNEGLALPAQVNYVGKGTNLYTLGYQHHGSVHVALNYLNLSYMWNKVRVQGGAYGAGLSFNMHSGMATYYSYRDPNLTETLKVYDAAGDYLRGVQMSADELTKNIIGTIGSVDQYQLPDAKGYSSMLRYLINYSDEERQQVRDEILSTTVKDIQALGDVLDLIARDGVVAIIGAQPALEASSLGLSITKVL